MPKGIVAAGLGVALLAAVACNSSSTSSVPTAIPAVQTSVSTLGTAVAGVTPPAAVGTAIAGLTPPPAVSTAIAALTPQATPR